MKLNLGIDVKPQLMKINAQLETSKVLEAEQLLKEFKDVFCMDIQRSERDSTNIGTTQK
jgi:hypothetical protein